MKALVTGGAGFIGSFIVDELVAAGHKVTVYDDLDPQVHGGSEGPPAYLNEHAEFIKGNILDAEKLYRHLKKAEILFHEAAAVGTGQSMYRIRHYVEQNSLGAAVLLDLVANRGHSLKKMIVASSMSVYGEGRYSCAGCGDVYPDLRTRGQLGKGDWAVRCPGCGKKARPESTGEDVPLDPVSIYAVTKRDHEEAFMAVGKAYKIPAVALRYFNTYGPRQALSNPYTGVCAMFSSRILNGQAPVIFEDGLQSRDFIHVKDVAKANMLAMEKDEADYKVFNVGTGRPKSILDVANILRDLIRPQSDITPLIENSFREGDIRHCFADISRIEKTLGFRPSVTFEDGVKDLAVWVAGQVCRDGYRDAYKELEERGLIG